jgi:23S rRNA-/tRNA-specific pseudouridylate synthase
MIARKTQYVARLQTFTRYLNSRGFCTDDSSSSLYISPTTPLEAPTVIYSDNHLLVVSKPAGWHSVPNSSNNTSSGNNKPKKEAISAHDGHQLISAAPAAVATAKNNNNKCLLTHLKHMKYGGGSRHDFLLPLHRLDQPCTGVLMFGKTSKAARRIQQQWSSVKKTYLCVLLQERTPQADDSSSCLDRLYRASVPILNDEQGYFELSGSFIPEYHQHQSSSSSSSSNRRRQLKKTVEIQPYQENVGRPCRLEWKRLHLNSNSSNENDKHDDLNNIALLQVRTSQGRRHMIRALLSQLGHCPIAGDLRYGGGRQQGETTTALPDESVALHAHTLQLPTSLELGSQLPPGMRFTSPIPRLWKTLFSITDSDVSGALSEAD